MEIETVSLKDLGFNIKEDFPVGIRDELVKKLKKIDHLYKTGDKPIEKFLNPLGYLSELSNKEQCQFFLNEFKHSVDFYHPIERIAIEVEKAEVKRIPHDIIKLLKASNKDKIDFGVLVIPKLYKTSNKSRPFFDIAKNDIQFYFKEIFESESFKIKDILIIIYDFDLPV